MTKDEIEKLAKEYCHQYLNDAFRIEPYFSKATDDNEYIITQSFKAGYLKGVQKLSEENDKLKKQLEVAIGAMKTTVGFEPFNSLEPKRISEALEQIERGDK